MSESPQSESAREYVSCRKEQQVPEGESPAREVHKTAAVSPDAGASEDTPQPEEKDGLQELPAGSTDLSRIALVGTMSPSGLDARVMEKTPRPPSTSDCTSEVGIQAEELSTRQLLLRIDARLEVLTNLAGPPVVNTPTTPPDGPTPPGSKPHSTTSATRKKWQHCPSLVPYLKGATLQNPLSDVDLQDAIRIETGYAPSLPALQNKLWKLVEEGRVNTYVRRREGNLTPYHVRRTKFNLYIAWRGENSVAPQPAPSDSLEAGDGDGTQVGPASPSTSETGVGAMADPRAQTTRHEITSSSKGFPRWLRQLGIRRSGIPTGR